MNGYQLIEAQSLRLLNAIQQTLADADAGEPLSFGNYIHKDVLKPLRRAVGDDMERAPKPNSSRVGRG
jgi:hypothetical protein